MLLFIIFFISCILTSTTVYFNQYLNGNVILWSIPLLLIAFMLLVFLTVVLILYIITLFVRPDKALKRPRPFYTFMIKIAAEFITSFLRVKLDIRGLDKVPTNTQFLLVGNHQSNLDPIINVWAFSKFKITFIMKDAIMKVPVLGRFLYGGGFLPLDRKNDRKALETIVTATKRLQEQVHPIAVYPEGTRSKGPHIKEFRNGVFKIAQKGKCPIVIAIVDNTYRLKTHFPFRRLKVLVEVVDVLDYELIKDMHTNELGDLVHQKMVNTLEQRRKELSYLKEV